MVRLSEKVRAVLVLLHGSGDSGPGVRSIMKATAGGHLLSRLAAAGVDVVCPTATPRSYRLQGAERMSVWFDRYDLTPEALEDAVSIDTSAERLSALLDEIVAAGVPPSRIVIGGFSMGGGMALQLALREASRGLAGVFALSGYMCYRSPSFALPGLGAMPSVFMRHGAADDFILPEWGEGTAAKLRLKGVAVDFATIPALGHWVSDDEIVELTAWILERLDLKILSAATAGAPAADSQC